MNFDFSYIDIAFVNGKVLTVNASCDTAEAVGVKGNRIVFVGSAAELMELIDEKTKVIDLKGRTLMPGMIDPHYHPILSGLIGTDLDSGIINTLPGVIVNSLADLMDLVRRCVATKKPGEWMSTMGFDGEKVPEKRWPTLEEMDAAAPDNPIQLMHNGGHFSYYNSKALAYLGVFGPEDAKKYPDGAVEVVDGKLTGCVRDHTHFWLWGQIPYPEQVQKAGALKMQKQLLENGVTSIHDTGECGASSYHIMQKLCKGKDREFRVRSYMVLHDIFGKPFSYAENEHWLELGLMTGLGDEYFKIGTCKFMIDGDPAAPSAGTRNPYNNHEWEFVMGWERDETADYIVKINEAECQATAHAMGDLAIEYMVNGYERSYALDPDRELRLRNRIEHCSMAFPDLIQRMAKCGIYPIMNPGMNTVDAGLWYKWLGPERMRWYHPTRSMIDAGMRPCFASDMPSGPVGLALIDGAVNRYCRATDFQMDQAECCTLMEAIQCCTINPAYAAFEENIKGSIEVGKLADMIILSEDITSVPSMELNRVKVDLTMIDGIVEYER